MYSSWRPPQSFYRRRLYELMSAYWPTADKTPKLHPFDRRLRRTSGMSRQMCAKSTIKGVTSGVLSVRSASTRTSVRRAAAQER